MKCCDILMFFKIRRAISNKKGEDSERGAGKLRCCEGDGRLVVSK